MRWARSAAQGRSKVFGGPGVERVVAGVSEAYALDSSYRTAHHGAERLDPAKGRMKAVPVPFEGPPVVTRNRTVRAFEENGLTVTAIEVSHSPVEPAYAWRFDYKGRLVVVSGDMVMRIRNVAIENGNARLAKILSDITAYHTTPIEAARIANDGGVKLLILTRFTPPVQNAVAEAVFTRGLSEIRSEGWEMAYDGMLVILPADSKEIEVGDIADTP